MGFGDVVLFQISRCSSCSGLKMHPRSIPE
jgi:hypothetical protein